MNRPAKLFRQSLSSAGNPAALWQALENLSAQTVGHKLFTVTTVEHNASLARRIYTSNANAYPMTGTKPLPRDAWHNQVIGQHGIYVANSCVEMAPLFPDLQLIKSLGCGSVLNLPIIVARDVVATVNLLHAEHHYGPERIGLAETQLSLPALACWAIAQAL